MSIKIYTKTGDQGNTSLLGGTKVPKSHIRIEAYGSVDELNSFIGLLVDHLHTHGIPHLLEDVQNKLFTIGSNLAIDPEHPVAMPLPQLRGEDITALEQAIDRMEQALPPLKSFILPRGHVFISTAHVARCVCRRAERAVVLLQQHSMDTPPLVIQYLNRLSDYLFVLARFIGHRLKVQEVPWKHE